MEPGELYRTKRANFIEKTPKYFEFLVSELGFDAPVHSSSTQPNGVILSDMFLFRSTNLNKEILISNSYHPNDYGFEVHLKEGKEEMIHHVLTEHQDIEQEYLKKAAEHIENSYRSRLS